MVLGSLFFTLSFGSYIFENEMIIYVSGALLGLFYAGEKPCLLHYSVNFKDCFNSSLKYFISI